MKVLGNGLTLLFFKSEEGIQCRVDYKVASEDLEVSRSFDVTMTATDKTLIKDFTIKKVIPQIKANEGIS